MGRITGFGLGRIAALIVLLILVLVILGALALSEKVLLFCLVLLALGLLL